MVSVTYRISRLGAGLPPRAVVCWGVLAAQGAGPQQGPLPKGFGQPELPPWGDRWTLPSVGH